MVLINGLHKIGSILRSKRKDGSFSKCGRWWRKKKKKKYPKCVPLAKARRMSKGQRAGAVKRKRNQILGGHRQTPQRLQKRKKAAMGGIIDMTRMSYDI